MWEFSSWLVTLTRPRCSSTTSQTTWRAATSDHFSHLRLTCWPLTWPPAYILQQSSPTLIRYTDVVTELPCHLETLHRYYNMVILQFPHRRQSLRRSALQDHLFSWGNLFLSVSLRKYHNSYLTTFSLFLWLSVELNLLCHRVFGCVGLIQGCSDPCRCFWHRGVCLQLAGLSGTCEQAGRRHKLIIQSPGGLDSSHYISSC